MLNAMRQGASGWVAKVLLGLLVLSFVVWGVAESFTGYGAATLATVGDEEITVPDFAQRNQQIQVMAQQAGRQVEPQQVLDDMLLTAALDDEARRRGLGVSDDRLAQEIADDPRFHRNGAFDRDLFLATLRNAGLDDNRYVQNVRSDLVRSQIAASMQAGADVPQPLVEALHRFRNEQRTISYIVLGADAIEPVGDPDEAVLNEYFAENRERFRAPEYRSLGLIVVDPQQLADPQAVTEEQVAAEYEARKATLTRPERRHVQQIRFDSPEAARAALESIESGVEFDAVVAESGTPADRVDLGMKTQAEIIDPRVAEAAFAAEPGEAVAVLDGALGPSVIRVTEVEPGSVTAQSEVAQRIREDLAMRAAAEEVGSLYDRIEDERAGGATLEEAARTLSLPYRVVEAVAADGTTPEGETLADLPARQQLLDDAFDSDVGVENNPLRAEDNVYVFYDVLEVIPARERDLDEVREEVVAEWQAAELRSRIAALADDLLARLQDGEDLAALAAEVGTTVETAEGVTRGMTPPGLGPNATAQAFAGPQGHVASADGAEPQQRILLRVDRVVAPPFFAEAADAQAITAQLAEALRNDLMRSYNRDLLQARDVRLNNVAYQQLTGQTEAR